MLNSASKKENSSKLSTKHQNTVRNKSWL